MTQPPPQKPPAQPQQTPAQPFVQKAPLNHIAYTWGKKKKYKQSNWFKGAQMFFGLMPIPIGCYLLYKAIKSFNRSPPPIATDSATVLSRPLYGEPVYQRVSFAPSTFVANSTHTAKVTSRTQEPTRCPSTSRAGMRATELLTHCTCVYLYAAIWLASRPTRSAMLGRRRGNRDFPVCVGSPRPTSRMKSSHTRPASRYSFN